MRSARTNDQPESIVWHHMKTGSAEAFELLYDRFFPLLFRYGAQFCPDRAVLKDCLQDFFVDIYVRRSSLPEVQHVKNYLYTAFRHRIIRHVSRKSLRLETLTDNYHFNVTFSHEHTLIQHQLDSDQQRYLVDAFQRLSSRQKEAIFLRFYEDMSYEEIAAILKMKKVKYARTLVYRAISVLREGTAATNGSLTLYAVFPLVWRLPSNW